MGLILWFYSSWSLCMFHVNQKRPYICPWSMLQPEPMLMTMVCAATEGHTDVSVLVCTWGHFDVLGPYCHQELWDCLRPMQQQRAMLMFMIYTVTRDHAEVLGICWYQRPYGCSWSFLSPETMCKSMVLATVDWKGWGNYFCHGINDYRLTVEKKRT